MQYSPIVLQQKLLTCKYFMYIENDRYCRMFWFTQYIMVICSIISNTCIVNNNITCKFTTGTICAYRNAYAHADSVELLDNLYYDIITSFYIVYYGPESQTIQSMLDILRTL